MKKIAMAALLVACGGIALAQVAPGAAARVQLQPASATDARLAAMEKRLQLLETENAALKEQVSHQKTSIKALDMVLTEFRATYVSHVGDFDNHIHYINGFQFSGFETGKIHGEDGVKTRVVTAGDHKPLWTGKPGQAHNDYDGPKK